MQVADPAEAIHETRDHDVAAGETPCRRLPTDSEPTQYHLRDDIIWKKPLN